MNIWKTIYNKPNNLKEIMKNILDLKNIDKEHVKEYMSCNVPVNDAYLFRDMKKAINEIKQHHNIFILFDYDCDGICAGAIMFTGLKHLSYIYNWELSYYVPLRTEGYG